MLTISDRSRAQLADAMAARDVPPEVAERVLDRFEEVGLVDDARFAGRLVEVRHAERGLSRRALGYELRRRGIDDETAHDALGSVTVEDEQSAARELVRRRAPSLAGIDPQRRAQRLLGMLARKGYGPGVAVPAVHEVLAELRLDDADLGEESADLGEDSADVGAAEDDTYPGAR